MFENWSFKFAFIYLFIHLFCLCVWTRVFSDLHAAVLGFIFYSIIYLCVCGGGKGVGWWVCGRRAGGVGGHEAWSITLDYYPSHSPAPADEGKLCASFVFLPHSS